MRWWWRRNSKPAAKAAREEENPINEFIEAISESPAEDKEIIDALHDAAVSLEKPSEHPPVILTDEWHGAPEAPDMGIADALDPFGSLIGTVLNALGKAFMQGMLDAWWKDRKQQLVMLGIADQPVVVDPAVSFAPGSCCLLTIKPTGEVTVLPGDNNSARDHPGMALRPLRARDWATQMHSKPDVRLTPEQVDAITGWISETSKRGPTVIIVPPQVPESAPETAAP